MIGQRRLRSSVRRDRATGTYLPATNALQLRARARTGVLHARTSLLVSAKRGHYLWFGLGLWAMLLPWYDWRLAAATGGVAGWLARRGSPGRWLLVVPAAMLAVAVGSWPVFALLLVVLYGVSEWIHRDLHAVNDPLAVELHLAAASFTKTPIRQAFRRKETWREWHNRTIAGQYRARTRFWRLTVEDERPVTVSRWTTVWYEDNTLGRERSKQTLAGMRHAYGPEVHDTDPTFRRNFVRHMVGTIGRPLKATWETEQNWVVLEPMAALPDGILAYETMPKATGLMTLGPTDAGAHGAVHVGGLALVTQDLETDPHTLVAGKTGYGKTAFARVRVAEHRRIGIPGIRLLLWDGKRGGAFTYLEGEPGIEVTTDLAVGQRMVARTLAELERRYKAREQAKRDRRPPPVFPRWVLIIDEYMSVMDDLAGDPDAQRQLLTDLALIARKGRECFMSLELYTQRPDVQGVGGAGVIGQMRDQFFKIQIGRGTGALAKMLFDDAGLSMRVPAKPIGLGAVLDDHADDADLIIFKAPFLPDPLEHAPTFADVVEADTTETVLGAAAAGGPVRLPDGVTDDDTVPDWLTRTRRSQARAEEFGPGRRRSSGL